MAKVTSLINEGKHKARQTDSRISLVPITLHCLCAKDLEFHGIDKEEPLKSFMQGNDRISLHVSKMTLTAVWRKC